MKYTTPQELFDFSATIAAPLLAEAAHNWAVLPRLGDFIRALGPTLDPARFEQTGEDVWIARSAEIAPTARIDGPCIMDEGAELRHCCFIRGSVIVGKNAVVGNSVELKNALLCDEAQVPHFNYVGDSILGRGAHMGAGAVTSNVKSDKTAVVIHTLEGDFPTGLQKAGAMLGDGAEIGCNSVLNPGTVIGRGAQVYPLSSVRGIVAENHIYKDALHIVKRR
ncbi:MAG: UDP-N-acetylglucosamine pyrophosphorylase [Clostridia bacterium]|nr:UDP-N-acetylglucosamine pyrophosphorylase [Clostridia bacterium]